MVVPTPSSKLTHISPLFRTITFRANANAKLQFSSSAPAPGPAHSIEGYSNPMASLGVVYRSLLRISMKLERLIILIF